MALAELLDIVGRRDDARALLLPAWAQPDADPQLLIALANLNPGPALAESLVDRLQLAARAPENAVQTQSLIHFAIGDLLDARDDCPLAFRHYSRANKLRRRHFSIERHNDLGRRAQELYQVDSEVAQNHNQFAPIFVIGMPRSGTSLVEQILAAHGQIAAAGEQHTLALAARNVLGELNNLTRDSWAATGSEQLEEIASSYCKRLEKRAQGVAYCSDKMWQNFEYLWLIKRVFPSAPIVLCVRHPMDVGLSCFTQSFGRSGPLFANDLSDIAHYYAHYEKLTRAVASLPANPLLAIHYEQLVDDTQNAARQLIDFVGLDWDPQCADLYEDTRVVRMASYAHVTQPIYRSSLARWRRYKNELAPLAEALESLGIDF